MFTIKEINHKNKLLNQILISKNNQLSATIYPNLGASLQQLSFNQIPILFGLENQNPNLSIYESHFCSAFLFPFPNRIKNGLYSFKNTNYELSINEKNRNHAIHGFIYNKPFQKTQSIANKNQAIVTLTYAQNEAIKGFPFKFEIVINYIFQLDHLELKMTIKNNGKHSFPFGLGWHPYFLTPEISKNELLFDADLFFLKDETLIPTKAIKNPFKNPLKLAKENLDDCFKLQKNETIFNTNFYQIILKTNSKLEQNYLQIFTPEDRQKVAIEPMTCAPNNFNNQLGLMELPEGSSYNWIISLQYKSKKSAL